MEIRRGFLFVVCFLAVGLQNYGDNQYIHISGCQGRSVGNDRHSIKDAYGSEEYSV